MKKSLFGSVAVVALIAANAASAADVAIKAPPRAPVPVARTWTGCYVNGGAGHGFFRQEQHAVVPLVGEVLLDETAAGSGWLGKIGGGCDYQFSPASGWGNWVVGAFADYDFMDLRGHLGAVAGAFLGTEKESSAVAAGGRIGYLVTPQILTYVNGGWSSTRFDGVSFPTSPQGVPVGVTLPGHTFNGGFIGGGTEVAVAALPGLYWRSEYRLASYRAADLQFNDPAGVFLGLAVFNHESKSVQTITTSLVWKFNATTASSADLEGLAGKAPPRASGLAFKAPPRALVPVATTWTGCYVNGGAGYGFFRQEQHAFSSVVVLEDETAGGSGWLGKVGGGCDYQFSPASGWGNWVVGAFADYDFMDLRGHLGVIGGALVGSEKESSAAAAGGRIGYLVTPQILTYVNGGWSSTRFDGVTFDVVTTGAATGITLPGHTFNGGFVGGGTEVAVAALPGLYWRSEYRYAGYGSADLAFTGSLTGAFNHESKNVQTITTSLVWKFH